VGVCHSKEKIMSCDCLCKENKNVYYTNVKQNIPHMAFIGRWAPLHSGHTWIIEQKLKEFPDKPVFILVRNTDFDEFTAEDRAELVKLWMIQNCIKGTIMIIPDIEGIYYGRGVGYNVEEIKPPENIKTISATKIREMIENNNNSWKDIVAYGTAEFLEDIIKKNK
jgi:citrate lyase synthetase